MTRFYASLICAALISSSAAIAQDTDTAETDGLSMGQDMQPEMYVRETHGAWNIQCIRAGENESCQMNQVLTNADGGQIAEISMFSLPEGAQATAGATIAVPLGTLLSEPLLIAVDDGVPRGYPYSVCNAQFCVAQVGFREQDVEAFRAGTTGVIAITSFENPEAGPVKIEMSLDGFSAAFDSLGN